MRPYSINSIARYGGLLGAGLGGGVGALTGLIGTESGSEKRKQSILRRALIGALAGGGFGALGGGLASSSARNRMLEPLLAEFDQFGIPALRAHALSQLKQQNPERGAAGLKRMMEDPSQLDGLMRKGVVNMMTNAAKRMRMSPGNSLKILFGADPRDPSNGMVEEFSRSSDNAEPPEGAHVALNNIVWDAIKERGLQPKPGARQ